MVEVASFGLHPGRLRVNFAHTEDSSQPDYCIFSSELLSAFIFHYFWIQGKHSWLKNGPTWNCIFCWRWGFSRPVRFPHREGYLQLLAHQKNLWKSKTSRIKQIPKTSKPPTGPVYSTLLYSIRLGKGVQLASAGLESWSCRTLQQLRCVMRGMILQQLQRPFSDAGAHEWSGPPRYPRGHWFPARGHCFPRRLEEFEGWMLTHFEQVAIAPVDVQHAGCWSHVLHKKFKSMVRRWKFPVLKWSLFWGHVDFQGAGRGNELHKTQGTHGRPT